MLALSVRQPWAWLIVRGHKGIENRVWSTTHRGPLLIHAGVKPVDDDVEVRRWTRDTFDIVIPERLPMGGIVGEAELVDVVTDTSDPWFFGPFGLVLRGQRERPFVAVRGRLKLFDVHAHAPAPT